MEEEYYTADEIAARFRVTRQAVYRWIREGLLRAIRVGNVIRIPHSALREFVKPANE